MPDETVETNKKAKSQGTLNISIEDLQQIISVAVAAATQASASTVAAAVVEAKKPVPDLAKQAADEQMKASTRIQRERDETNTKMAQESCPHHQGCSELSSYQGPLSSFIIHILDTGLPVAICTNCLMKVFGDTTDPAERKIFRMKHGNHPSASGQRFFRNPEAVQKAGR